MEINERNVNSFNVSHHSNGQVHPHKTNVSYLDQIKELVNRRHTDTQKNDFPLFISIKDNDKIMNTIENKKNIPSIPINNMKITNVNSFKITSEKPKRFSNRAMSIDTKTISFIPTENKTEIHMRNLRQKNSLQKDTNYYESCPNMNIIHKATNYTTPAQLITHESYNKTSNISSNEARKMKFLNNNPYYYSTEVQNSKESYYTSLDQKMRYYHKYLTSGSTYNFNMINFQDKNSISMGKIKSLFMEYKHQKNISKSKSGNWLIKISPSLLYRDHSKDSRMSAKTLFKPKEKSHVYPTNKLYKW